MARSASAILLALTIIGLSATASLSANNKHENNNKNFCQGCHALVSFAQQFNASQERASYEDVFRQYCQLYYPASTDFQQGPCAIFTKGLFQWLDHVDPVHHCDQIGACGPTEGVAYTLSPQLASSSPKQADAICKFCEQSIEQVQSALEDPNMIAQVRRQADELCAYLKVVDADKECRQLLNKYLEQTIDFVRNIDPRAYCRSIQLCAAPAARPSSAAGSRAAHKHLASLADFRDFRDFGLETSVVIGPKQQQETEREEASRHETGPIKSAECAICKDLVKEMFKFLRDNKTEANIVAGLDQVCQLIFARGDKLDQCQSMVRAYTRELIQLLIDESDPEMVCILLEQCVGRTVARNEPALQQQQRREPPLFVEQAKSRFNLGSLINSLEPSTRLRSAKICFECKMFIKYLRSQFDKPQSRDLIKVWLEQELCQKIPDKATCDECKLLIDQYADTFFQAVLGSLDPAAACSDLGACTGQTANQVFHIDLLAPYQQPDQLPSFRVSPKQPLVGQRASQQVVERAPKQKGAGLRGQICDQCVQIISQVDDYLSKHPVDKDVSVLVEQVCNRFPEKSSIRSECTQIMQTFGSEIAQAVASMDNPRQLCSSVYLC